jgi:cobalamin biosynthesis Mg chelatase CobN
VRPARSTRLALAAVAVAGVLGLLGVPSPAAAHSAAGEMTVLRAEQVGPGEVQVEVGIVFSDDGHLAEEATVTATPTAADGSTRPPVALPQISGGRYGGPVAVDASGTWSMAVASTDPTAAATATVEVADQPAAPSTTAPPTTGSTTSRPSTTTPTTSGTAPPATTAAGGSSSSSAPLVVGIVGAVAVAAVASAVVLRRGRPGPGA